MEKKPCFKLIVIGNPHDYTLQRAVYSALSQGVPCSTIVHHVVEPRDRCPSSIFDSMLSDEDMEKIIKRIL